MNIPNTQALKLTHFNVEQWIVKKKTLHSKQYITSFFCSMINSLQKKIWICKFID